MTTATPISALILDTFLKATVLLVLAWAGAVLLKTRAAATLHLVRACALAALLLLPVSVVFLPAWHVKGIPSLGANAAATRSAAPGTSARPADVSASPQVQPETSAAMARAATATWRQSRPIPDRATTAAVTAETRSNNAAAPRVSIAPSASTSNAISQLPVSAGNSRTTRGTLLPSLLVLIWGAGALFFLARWKINSMRLAGLLRRAGVLTDSGWNAQVRALAANLGI